MVSVLQRGRGNLSLVAICGEVIAIDARFNIWVALVVKDKSKDKNSNLLELVDFYADLTDECRESVRSFEAGSDSEKLIESLVRLKISLEKELRMD